MEVAVSGSWRVSTGSGRLSLQGGGIELPGQLKIWQNPQIKTDTALPKSLEDAVAMQALWRTIGPINSFTTKIKKTMKNENTLSELFSQFSQENTHSELFSQVMAPHHSQRSQVSTLSR